MKTKKRLRYHMVYGGSRIVRTRSLRRNLCPGGDVRRQDGRMFRGNDFFSNPLGQRIDVNLFGNRNTELFQEREKASKGIGDVWIPCPRFRTAHRSLKMQDGLGQTGFDKRTVQVGTHCHVRP